MGQAEGGDVQQAPKNARNGKHPPRPAVPLRGGHPLGAIEQELALFEYPIKYINYHINRYIIYITYKTYKLCKLYKLYKLNIPLTYALCLSFTRNPGDKLLWQLPLKKLLLHVVHLDPKALHCCPVVSAATGGLPSLLDSENTCNSALDLATFQTCTPCILFPHPNHTSPRGPQGLGRTLVLAGQPPWVGGWTPL